MARAERPQWVKALISYAYKSAHVHHKLMQSREKYSFQHRQIVQDLQLGPTPDVIDVLEVCDRLVLGSVASPVSGEEWDAVGHWHRNTSRLLTALPHIADQLCETCTATVQDSGVTDFIEDDDLTEAISAVFDLIERVSKQGAAQRRRALRILQDATESGTTTTIQVTKDGLVTFEHGGLTAGYIGKETG